MSIFSIIDQVAKTSSLKEKQAILETNSDNTVLKMCFFYAENPRFNFYIKADPALAEGSSGKNDISKGTFLELDKIIQRKVTGNDARLHLQSILLPLTEDARTIVIRIVNRDLRCNAGTTIANKVWKNLIPEYPVMLASKGDAKSMKYLEQFENKEGFIVQKKCDGGRVNIIIDNEGTVTYRSRNGSELNLYGFFDTQFTKFRNMVFDGELLVRTETGVEDRKTGNGLYTKAVRGTLSKAEVSRFSLEVWDVVNLDEFNAGIGKQTYKSRLSTLIFLLGNKLPSFISVVESKEVKTLREAYKFYDEMRDRGEEGCIIKVANSLWEDRRSKNMVKMKAEETADLRVIGVEEGSGKYRGMIGALVCETDDHELVVRVGTGFVDADRMLHPNHFINMIVEVGYNEVIASRDKKEKSLFLPVFKGIRYDKSQSNLLKELK